MRLYKTISLAAVALLAFSPAAVAAGDEALDVTMQVVESPADLPAAVTKTIELPPQAAQAAKDHAQFGLDTANAARSKGREFGKSVAEEAKTRGKGKGKGGQGRP